MLVGDCLCGFLSVLSAWKYFGLPGASPFSLFYAKKAGYDIVYYNLAISDDQKLQG